jgi:hypothetical protein
MAQPALADEWCLWSESGLAARLHANNRLTQPFIRHEVALIDPMDPDTR